MITAAPIAPGARSDTSWQNSLPLEERGVEIKSTGSSNQNTNLFNRSIKFFKNYAGIIDSRESITRLILDLTAFDIPTVLAGATRNWSSFCEACLEAGLSTVNLMIAPNITKLMAKIASKIFLAKEDQKHYYKLTRFYRHELHNESNARAGISRILTEEPRDLNRIADLYKNIDKDKKAQDLELEANELQNYFINLDISTEKLKSFINFKEATLLFESSIEGGLWGSFGLALRWFRKNILKQEGFSGTKAYVNKEEAKKLGETKPLALWQKILGSIAIVLSPIMNFTLMKLCRDRNLVKENKFLQLVDKGLDMTHGLYPKLGLLFSYTTIPKWFGALATVQGMDELIERIMKLVSVIPSWWLGHRITNGGLSAYYDKQLAEKYNIDRGILLEPKFVGKFAPDPAKIHHVLERTKDDRALQKEARDKHAGILYSGLGLHSLGVLGVTLFINQLTKWRVQRKLNKN